MAIYSDLPIENGDLPEDSLGHCSWIAGPASPSVGRSMKNVSSGPPLHCPTLYAGQW